MTELAFSKADYPATITNEERMIKLAGSIDKLRQRTGVAELLALGRHDRTGGNATAGHERAAGTIVHRLIVAGASDGVRAIAW